MLKEEIWVSTIISHLHYSQYNEWDVVSISLNINFDLLQSLVWQECRNDGFVAPMKNQTHI